MNVNPLEAFQSDYMSSDEYPGADRASGLLERLILSCGRKAVVDIGGALIP